MFWKIAACFLASMCLLCTTIDTSIHSTKMVADVTSTFTVKVDNQRWSLDLRKIGFDGVDPTTLNQGLLLKWVRQVVESKVNRVSQDAHFQYRAIVPHVIGRLVDEEKLLTWLNNIHAHLDKPNNLPFVWEMPKITTAQALSLKEKMLGSYTTWFNPYNINRANNIRLSSQTIDHVIVRPGETFSFNRTIGKRTSRGGYRTAKIIVKGKYKKGVGGGICQTSSTLYNCADKAGLKIVERYPHSKRVNYVPKNRDASVTWLADFKFKNQLVEPILVVSDVIHGRLRISIYGPETVKNNPRHVPLAPQKALD